MPNAYEFSAQTIDGKTRQLSDFHGQVTLIVNTASQCGFTPQYQGLEALYQRFKDYGFTVLAFPCNQFGSQEPGTESDIAQFCERNYGVSFPLFAKVDVNGADAHALYQYLKSTETGVLGSEAVKWNFTKFLVGKDGQVIKRYAPNTAPEDIADDVKTALAA